MKSRKILVRDEYKEAEKVALLANTPYTSVFAVCGQPGIGLLGKSIFLLWLLIRRLALHLPTVLQVTTGRVILFHEAGVSEFTDHDDHPAFDAFMSPPEEYLPPGFEP